MGQPYIFTMGLVMTQLGLIWVLWFGSTLNSAFLFSNLETKLGPFNFRFEALCLIGFQLRGLKKGHLIDQINPDNQGPDQTLDPPSLAIFSCIKITTVVQRRIQNCWLGSTPGRILWHVIFSHESPWVPQQL